ncbi:hypothetical protein BYT27DRAFT_7194755 [Phlegmacium glaucopus]|nr:hypothetical protein BYT27DRAFT_7194755 [Phlegmacium glaucopus]
MNQGHLEAVIWAENDNLPTPLSPIISNSPPSMLLYLLPPCLILLAIDVALRISQRPSEDCVPLEIPPNQHKLKGQQAITGCNARAKGVIDERQQPTDRNRMLVKQRNFAHHRQRLLAYSPVLVTVPLILPGRGGETRKLGSNRGVGVRPSFTAFCDRLLLQNKIWNQQREIKDLRRSLDSKSMANCSNAFKAFCDRLVLTNKIWKLQTEVAQLTAETEKIKRSRVVAVTRAAKQMVLDVRKERLVEEFVKELMADLEESRRAIKSLRLEHEREIEEMAGEWRKDYRRLSDEIEKLQLAQEARLVEQELSNTMESELIERLGLLHQKAGRRDCMAETGEDTETLSGSDLEFEEMSNTSTSTYVGSTGERSPNFKSSFSGSSPGKEKLTSHQRAAKLSPLKIPPRESGSTYLRISPVAKSQPDPGPYVGFSFNPLFFGPADNSKDDLTNRDSTRHVFSLKGAPQHRRSIIPCRKSTSGDAAQSSKPPKRVQWKV